jgi:hypothetical protein
VFSVHSFTKIQGRIQDFKLGGALKKIAPSGGIHLKLKVLWEGKFFAAQATGSLIKSIEIETQDLLL